MPSALLLLLEAEQADTPVVLEKEPGDGAKGWSCSTSEVKKKLTELLNDLRFIAAKVEVGFVGELLYDYEVPS